MDTHFSLGIPGLSASATSMVSGGLYLIASGSDDIDVALLFANLPAVNRHPMLCCSRLAPAPRQNTAWLDRRLATGSLLLLAPKPAPELLLTACLEELRHGLDRLRAKGANALLAIGNAEDYLRFGNPKLLQQELSQAMQWAARTGHCVLLLVNQQRLDMASLAMLSQAARNCGGVVQTQSIGVDTYSWQVDHWLGADAAQPEAQVLIRNADGALTRFKADPDDIAARPANDILQVYATATSMTGNEPPTPLWQQYEDLDALLEATRDAVAASVLLDTAGRQREALVEAVSKLRQRGGSRLKIFVREVGNRRLRQNEAQLMLRLGANMVLPAELQFASTVSLIHAMQPAVFQQYSQLAPERLQDASQPLPDRGYLLPERFVEAVRNTVQRSGAINIANTLVIFKPAGGIGPRELLEQGRFQRAGDLCSADWTHAYLFLFACGESDVQVALKNLFRLPISELAENEVRCPDSASILQALSRLEGQGNLPDFNQALADVEHQAPAEHAPTRIAVKRAALQRRKSEPETP
ncbi:cellulose biosynthesis protein BcsE [Chromobacterium sp. IIBBL 290-4]|uniref:cellulose biosynthesis protein BcsE n=1 Tax=Chromobacterium sp. IIBBL 290-4 TaxID=2953890 RepID=UPI0020B851A7|nr:cellulose biosynthesis protein BcsE [Chromobacterium sp. IIBBL 290-4]UTH73447.1 cellulose biosynthesis protein BcsE [Chromobacterium sp. IIBBL 290-4]